MLHVTNGDIAAEKIAAAGVGGAVLPWRDVLHEGPVPREDVRAARAAFIASRGWSDVEPALATMEARDAAVACAERLVLWFEHDLFDQLQLLQALAQRDGPAELIQSDRFLGDLSVAEMAALWPRRAAVTPAQRARALRAWDALRAEEPSALAAEAAAPADGLPHLGAALRRLLEEYPGARDGLSRSERQLLAALADGPLGFDALFAAWQACEEAPFAGDATIAWTLAELARADHPLVCERDGVFALTAAGARVLAGEADHVALNGIDRWIGGVRLQGRAVRWRWDGERLSV